MMSKGIAIRSILLLLVGVLVAVVLIFTVFRYITAGGLSLEECRVIITNACNTCKVANWDLKVELSDEVRECSKHSIYIKFYDDYNCQQWGTQYDCGDLGLD